MKKCRIKFNPGGKKIEVEQGADLLSAAISCGIYINSSCGGEGICGRCRVLVKKGKYATERSPRISEEERKKGYV